MSAHAGVHVCPPTHLLRGSMRQAAEDGVHFAVVHVIDLDQLPNVRRGDQVGEHIREGLLGAQAQGENISAVRCLE